MKSHFLGNYPFPGKRYLLNDGQVKVKGILFEGAIGWVEQVLKPLVIAIFVLGTLALPRQLFPGIADILQTSQARDGIKTTWEVLNADVPLELNIFGDRQPDFIALVRTAWGGIGVIEAEGAG